MKVWSVWGGSYSDRGMRGIFSTFEKAEAFRSARALFEYDIDDQPSEHDVDAPNTEPDVALVIDEDTDSVTGDYHAWQDNEVEWQGGHSYSVKVAFQPDRERMIKAARDKLAAFQALKAGI